MSFDPNSDAQTLLLQQIEDLDARAVSLQQEANEINKLRDSFILDFVHLHHGVKAGMVVLTDHPARVFDDCEEVLVVEVLPRGVNFKELRWKPWLNVRKKRKDGSWSGKVLSLFGNWKLKPQVATGVCTAQVLDGVE